MQNLFPSISLSETILLVSKLFDRNYVNPIIKYDMLNALKVCLKQKYFQFDNKTSVVKPSISKNTQFEQNLNREVNILKQIAFTDGYKLA